MVLTPISFKKSESSSFVSLLSPFFLFSLGGENKNKFMKLLRNLVVFREPFPDHE